MVATVVGFRLGLEQTSAWVLGSRGQLGSAALGRGGDDVSVNAATGNLVVTNRDELLVGRGADVRTLRSYNSQGALNDDNGDNWRFSIQRRLTDFPASPGAFGSTISRIGEDGSTVTYAWDAAQGAYVTKEGAGAYDRIVANPDGSWTWTDGDAQTTELYDGGGNLISVTDADGNQSTFSYEVHNGAWRLKQARTADGGYTEIIWSGDNVYALMNAFYDPAISSYRTLARVRYTYDGQNRLSSVNVDMTPDNSIADGQSYITTYTYDGSSKRVASISQTDGSRIDVTYESGGAHRVASITQSVAEGVSRTTRYAYVSATRTDVTAPDGLITSLEYDSVGQLTRVTEPAPVGGGTRPVREFTYDAHGNVTRVKTSPNTWTDFVYDDANGDGTGGDHNGLWTRQYERTGDGGYIAARRTYDARNALLTETRFQTLDPDGPGAVQAENPLTTRYVYDAENHLRFVVTATGDVTRHDYASSGSLTRTTVFTGAGHDLSGLAWNQSLSEAAMDAWAAGLADKSQAQITDYVYDFRGALLASHAYGSVQANGQPDLAAQASSTHYVHDHVGRVVSRSTNAASNSQTFVYDGLGRLISTVDFNGATTRTTYHDRAAVTVETTPDGLNKVSVHNRAGELVSYSESERGANLVDLSAWPEYDPDLPSGHAAPSGWNTGSYAPGTRWQTVRGPDGTMVAAMQAGQLPSFPSGGGGGVTNTVPVDGTKDYEFVYYFKKDDLSQHLVYFGLSSSSPAYVQLAGGSTAEPNPYFVYFSDTGHSYNTTTHQPLQQERWYKVVGHVYAQGSAQTGSAATGVFDVETGQKMAEVQNYRWNPDRPFNEVHSRFFDYYQENEPGFSTHFYKPEIRRIDAPGTNLVDLTGWPGPAGAPNGQATVPGWTNGWATNETAWKLIDGPYGRKVVAMQAGQYDPDQDGGGNYTNEFTIDGSKNYEFVYYVRKDKLNDHALFFGLSTGSQAYVEYADGAHGGMAETNPYFFGSSPSVYASSLQEDRWYKVVGHVLAEGSANVASGSLGGVYDMETGQKVMSTYAFRWRSGRPDNQVHSRFFTYYEAEKTGFSTYFHTPEVRRTDQPSINLVDASGWPQPVEPDQIGAMPGWLNNYQTAETRWHVTHGPEGRPVVAMQAGQIDQWDSGGGNFSPNVKIDGNKAYEFTIYLKKEDLTRHHVYWGLTYSTSAYVDHAVYGSAESNPYFYWATTSTQQSTLVEDRWYKVVGYVLPQGSASLNWDQAPGGVYDTVTGEKVAQTNPFRWRTDRPDDQVHARFFDYYEHTRVGWSTSFYRPEMREVDLAATPNLVDNSGWPAPGGVPAGPAVPPAWNNPEGSIFAQETRWTDTIGPNGRRIIAIEAGQMTTNVEGGGGSTNKFDVDVTSAYKFVYHFRKHDTSKHNLYFGLSDYHDPAYVEYATTGAAESNPYFLSWGTGTQQALLSADKWYRVEGWVLPAGSPLVASHQQPGGVFDVETGQKIADVQAFRWKAALPTPEVAGRFFTFYDEAQSGYSTFFGQPEIHKVDVSKLTGLLPAASTRHQYDKMGRLRMTTDPTGRSTHHLYDDLGRKVGQIDGDGSLVEYKYDGADRLTATVRYAGRLTSADLRSLTDGAGNPATTEIAWIRPAASVDDAWSWTIHDQAGRVVQTIDGDGSATSYVHDGASRLIAETRYATKLSAGELAGIKAALPSAPILPSAAAGEDRTTRHFHDAAGRRIGSLDAEGFLTRIVHDRAGQVIQTTAFATVTSEPLRASGTFGQLLGSVGSSAADVHEWSVFDGRGFLVGTVNGEGDVVIYTRSALGHVVLMVTGKRLSPAPSSQPTLAQLVSAPAAPVEETTAYDRNHLGQVLKEYRYTAAGREDVTYAYDPMWRLVGVSTDRVTGADHSTRSRHDARGRLIGQLAGRGAAELAALGSNPTAAQINSVYRQWGVTFTYDDADRLISRTDPDGVNGPGLTSFTFYDADGSLAYEVNALGEVRGYVHDAQNRLTQTIVFNARISTVGLKGGVVVAGLPSRTSPSSSDSRTIVAYNADDTVRATIDALGAETAYTYNAFGEVRTRQDPFGATTTSATVFEHDRRGLVKQTTEDWGELNRITQVAHDAFGRAIQTVDGRGGVRSTLYDRAGRVKVVRDALGQDTTYAYDARGNVVSVTDRMGKTTSFSHSAHDRTLTVTTPEGLVTTTTFDDRGHTLTVTDGGGRTTTHAYDLDGRLTTDTDGLGQSSTNAYDSAGRLHETTDATGRKISYGYDGAGRVLTETVDPGGLNLVTAYVYDGKGQKIRTTDPSGVHTDYVFDVAGRTTEVVVANAFRTQFTYDRAGNVINLREAAGTSAERDTSYIYDKLGRLTYQQTGDGGLHVRAAFDYDADGNVIRRRDGVSTGVDVSTRYVYDAEGRLTFTIDPVGAVTKNEYDAEGRIILVTAYSTLISPTGVALTSAQVVSALGASGGRTTDYVYDGDGRLTYLVQSDGRLTRYGHDGSGNVTGQRTYGKLWEPFDPNYALGWPYTVAGLDGITGLSVFKNDPHNRSTSAVYDAAGRQRFTVDAMGFVTSFSHDAAGRVTVETQHASAYAGEISEAALASWSATPQAGDRKTRTAYDAAGRASFVVDAEGYATRTAFDGAGRIASVSRFAVQLSLPDGVTHDALTSLLAAHVSTASTTSFTYDGAGRRYRTVHPEGFETQVLMDGLGRPTEIHEAYGTVDLRITHRTYDDGGRLIAEVVAPGLPEEVTRSWAYDGLGRTLYVMHGIGYPTSYTYDAMGRVLTEATPISASETAVTANTYDAFGNLVKVVDPRGAAGFFYYDVLDRLVLQVDPEGHATRTTYNRGGEVETVTRHALKVSGTPAVGAPPTVGVSAADAVTTFVRDKLDRVTQVIDAEGKAETYALNAFGDRTAFTNKLGATTTYTHDRRGLTLSETLPVSAVRGDGTVLATSVVNSYEYDARGNLTKTIEASNVVAERRTTTYAYDKMDRLVQKSGDAVTVQSAIDLSTSTVTPTETIAYDRRGNVIETRDAVGARTLFFYDDADRKVAEIDALGGLKTWGYDDNDNATVQRAYDTPVTLPALPGGPAPVGSGAHRQTLMEYDRNNRLIKTTVQQLWVAEYGSSYAGSVVDVHVQTRYDAAGNVVQTIDGRGVSTYAFHDKLGRQIAAVDGEGWLTTWTRDAEGNVLREIRWGDRVVGAVTSARDPATLPPRSFDSSKDRITDFTYDRNGRRLTETRYSVEVYAAGAPERSTRVDAVVAYSYDALGNVTRKTEANGDVSDFTHDVLGRLTRERGAAFVDHLGQTVRLQTDTAYTGLGEVARVAQDREGGFTGDQRVTTFAYGAGGRLTSTTDATGFTRFFGHDAAGRTVLESYVRVRGDDTTVVDGNRRRYDLLGQMIWDGSATHAGSWSFGDTRTFAYNAHGEVVAKGVNGLWQERFEYDHGGRLYRSTAGDGVTRLHLHDAAGRATVTMTATTRDVTAYTAYDVMQGLTAGGVATVGAHDFTGTSTTYTQYDARGLAVSTRQPFAQLSWDAVAGTYATTTIVQGRAYDAFGQVISETDAAGAVTEFTYNALGRLIEQRSPQVAYVNEQGQTLHARPTEQRRYDVSGRLIATRTANGFWTSRTLKAGSGHDGGEAIVTGELFADGASISHGVDVFGDVRRTVDQLGHVTLKDYDKAGRVISIQHPGRAAWTPGNDGGSTVQL
ncbi:hypothetical protein, partial [Brevundimonas sp.]|uniref:hypothetical protein n=1 Tax=Brevundimonas sp. TaxID=1871086 RepID=UPI002E0D709A|nr:hypothetical protein [Brevundimonas sp.]